MNSLNSVIIEGNVAREAESRITPTGSKVCTFAVMSTRTYKKEEGFEKEISFFDVDVWGKLADVCEENITKGRGIRVVGRLKQSRWTNEEGKNRSKINIVAEHVEFKPLFKKTPEDEKTLKEIDSLSQEIQSEDEVVNF